MANMEFANRVDKIFGSLGTGSSSSAPWRIRDQKQQESSTQTPPEMPAIDDEGDEEEPELEGEEDDNQERPFPPSTCRQFQFLRHPNGSGVMDAEEDLEEEGLQMRSIIGLDTTLDFEEEEDEFDKTAVGREADKDRLFMREINEVNANYESSGSLPLSFYDLKHVPRDPRANHLAAKARLDEDARQQESQKKNIEEYTKIAAQEPKGDLISCLKRNIEPEDGGSIDSQKSVMSKENVKGENEKPLKRVRFSSDTVEPTTKETGFMRPKSSSQFASHVPDFVKNPSKYTRYTLDWSVEDNERTNLEAFHACFKNIKANQCKESDVTEEMPGRMQYIPRNPKLVEGNQKINLVDAEKTVVRISRTTMCVDQFENESIELGNMGTGNIADSSDVVQFENESILLSNTDTGNIANITDVEQFENESMDVISNIDTGRIALERKIEKATRRYRLKRETEVEMEMDSPK